MPAIHRRHDISDRVWEVLEPHLLGRKGTWGGNARDNRLFINAVFWILRTGAPWRDLPPDFGDWKNTHRRFCRWRDKGIGERLLETLIDEPDFEWLRFIPMRLGHGAATKTWPAQKGAQLQDTSGRGCAWYAGQNVCYGRYHSGLRSGL